MSVARRPIGIDLFAGAGGMSLGFEQAGFDIAVAVELDPIHACTHAFNFTGTRVIPKSVVGLEAAEIRRLGNIGHRKVDVVFGGAPCQGFSLIGQRALDDPRNKLVREFVRIVHDLDASYFVFENVKGLTIGKHKSFLNELIDEFSSRGYEVLDPWKVLNAVDFGVPQSRERFFLLGAKKNLRLPRYPNPITRPAGSTPRLDGLPEGPSCMDAIGDLPDAERFQELIDGDSVETKWGNPSEYARKLRCLDNDVWYYSEPRKWNPSLLTSSMRTDHTDISRRRFEQTAQGNVEPISRFYRLPSKGVCNTLRAGTDSARGAFTSPRPIHYSKPRCITVREMARLHGYPDWFRFHVTKWHGARQVGNSVPPPLARAVASKIIEAMGISPKRPAFATNLGKEEFLRFEMSEAASTLGVLVPIARRNKKSGARKRKQSEIEDQHQKLRAARG
jgi:DNA (cytosine-5)-methyltransferase 1